MANRFLVSGGDGNWNSTNNWAATTGGSSGASFPVALDVVAFDSNSGNAAMTVNVASACASLIMSGTYAGTLTFDSTLTLTSTVTFISACTIAGTTGTLILSTGGQTITSGGKTLTCALTFATSAVYTLADNWTVNGLVTAGVTTGTSTFSGNQVTCAGGFHQGGTTANLAGTMKLIFSGGTWNSSSTGRIDNNIDLAGNVTVSGAVVIGSTTLRYLSGTITTTGSTLSTTGTLNPTLDTSGVTWNNVTFLTPLSPVVLTSNLVWSGTLTLNNTGAITVTGAGQFTGTGPVVVGSASTITFNNTGGLTTTGTMTLPNAAMTFAGTAGFTVGALTTTTLTASRIYTLTFGNTYTVTTGTISTVGTTASILQTIKSSSAGNKVVFILNTAMTAPVRYCSATDVDSSGGQTIYTYNGVLSNTTNWTNANATRFLVSGGSGNWNNTNNWSLVPGGASGAAFPVAGDEVEFDTASSNAAMTVNVASACATLIMTGTYAGTLTFTSTLTLTSTVTFVSTCTIAGTAGTLIGAGTGTYTSGGKTLTCALTFSTGSTYTLGDNWTVNGLVTVGSSSGTCTINQTTTQKITCAGGIHQTNVNATAGSAKLEITGGTWDAVSTTSPLTMNVDLAGNVTVSGSVNWGNGKTLRYVSGTVTTTGSTIIPTPPCTLDTNGMTWNIVTLGAGGTFTLSSNFGWAGLLTFNGTSAAVTFAGAGTLAGPGSATCLGSGSPITFNNTGGLVTTGTLTLPDQAMTFAGSGGFTVGTLTTATLSLSRIHTLTFGNTYGVTTALSNIATTTVRQALKSGTPGSKVVFTVSVGASVKLTNCDPTDIDSNAGGRVLSTNGVLTTTNNWVNSIAAGVSGAGTFHCPFIKGAV